MLNRFAGQKRPIVRKISEYFKDSSGNIAIFFGLALPVALVAIGAGLDSARITREYSTFHAAIDSAAFAIAQDDRSGTVGGTISQTNADALKDLAKKYIASNYSADKAFKGDVTVDLTVTGQQVKLNANIEFPTTLMKLVGIETVSMNAESVVEKAMKPIELVLVMDTTGSMVNDIAGARQAAKNFLTKVYGSTSTTSEYLRIALVPFAGAVRLNPTAPEVLSAVDQTGANPLSTMNFSLGVLNNFTAWAAITKPDGSAHSWNGCVEGRQRNATASLNYLINDEPPGTGATRFPAYFFPDAPSFDGTVKKTYRDSAGSNQSNKSFYEPWHPNATAFASVSNPYDQVYSGNDYVASYYNVTVTQSASPVKGTLDANNYPAPTLPTGYPLIGGVPMKDVGSNLKIQHKAVAPPATGTEVSTVGYGATATQRLTNDRKYQGAVVPDQTYTGTSSSAGPWVNCAASAVVPMTHSRTKVEAGLDAMRAAGNTNIGEGLAWGMRVISPGAPFTLVDSAPTGAGTPISNYNDVRWQKIIVLMTDGENTAGSASADLGASYNSYGRSNVSTASGLNRFGTTTTSSLVSQMNADTLQVCSNLKANGVQIYTIGFRDPATAALMAPCATAPTAPYYQFASDTTALAAVFNHIGEDVLNKMIYVSK
jgi:Flp pilus assembly protein TadG